MMYKIDTLRIVYGEEGNINDKIKHLIFHINFYVNVFCISF